MGGKVDMDNRTAAGDVSASAAADRSGGGGADVVTAGQTTQLYYNRLWGPARSGRSVDIKAGFNDWSHIVEAPLQWPPSPQPPRSSVPSVRQATGHRPVLQREQQHGLICG